MKWEAESSETINFRCGIGFVNVLEFHSFLIVRCWKKEIILSRTCAQIEAGHSVLTPSRMCKNPLL
jgi:hypothetical protein